MRVQRCCFACYFLVDVLFAVASLDLKMLPINCNTVGHGNHAAEMLYIGNHMLVLEIKMTVLFSVLFHFKKKI